MTLDLDIFVEKINSIVRRNRIIYDLLEFFAVSFILLFLAVFFDLGAVLKYIPFTEPYVGLSPSFLPGINYEIIFLFFVGCLLSLLLFGAVRKNRDVLYDKLHIIPMKREKATNVVERFYPNLKDRLNTAYDNKSNHNIVSSDLKEAVSNDVDSVTFSGLLDLKRLVYSLGTILVTGMFLIAVILTGITSPLTPDNFFDKNPNGTIELPPTTPESGSNNSSSIPTDIPPISTEPGVDIDITLPPGVGVGPGDMLENSTENIFQPSEYYPPESLSSHHYYEILPEGYEDVIKDYFKQLAEQT